jgi:PAS domain S-box-containing protein
MATTADPLDSRILIVDDDLVDARVLEAMLAGAGYRNVTLAVDPREAIRMHAASPFDLVMLDVAMSGMDGFEALRELRALNPELPVPVIMVTGDPAHMRRALEEGARDFIAKPVTIIEVLSRARTALEVGRLLRESEGRYRVIVEQSIAGIYTVEDGRWTYANARLCEWLGYTREELCGMQTLDLVVPEDRERVLANRARRDAGDARALVATYRLRARNGSVRLLSFDARMIDLRGRKVVFGIALDFTDRERARELLLEAEKHYRALVEQSFVGIYLVQDERLIYANPRLCEILGYTQAELGRLSILDIVDGEDRPVIEEMMRRRRAEGSASVVQARARHKDGAQVFLDIETKLIELAGRSAVIGVVQDSTHRRRAQDELHEANRRLRTLSDRVLAVQEEERRRIARELHDDIGQSLVALGIALHRIEPHVADASRQLLAQCIEMTNGVRERVREISMELHPPHLDQLGLQDALRWLVARNRELTGIDIRTRFSGVEDGRFAPAVEAACYRICQEALANAEHHAEARRITLHLAVRAGELIARVRDDGVGFDPAAQRAAVLTKGSMGLISMEERARLAGGRFELRSAPGDGTTVTACFPAARRERPARQKEKA